MGACFIQKELIPRVGKEDAAKFPIMRTGPGRDGTKVMSESLGLEPEDPNQETWFLVDSDRFPEIYDYLINKYRGWNDEIAIQDLRVC